VAARRASESATAPGGDTHRHRTLPSVVPFDAGEDESRADFASKRAGYAFRGKPPAERLAFVGPHQAIPVPRDLPARHVAAGHVAQAPHRRHRTGKATIGAVAPGCHGRQVAAFLPRPIAAGRLAARSAKADADEEHHKADDDQPVARSTSSAMRAGTFSYNVS
jgi:hypothetical protein